jgi:hypothetical protein
LSKASSAARVCIELRQAGIIHANPQNADLLELIAQGVEMSEFISAAHQAVEKGKGFPYVIGIVRGRVKEKIPQAATAGAAHLSVVPGYSIKSQKTIAAARQFAQEMLND